MLFLSHTMNMLFPIITAGGKCIFLVCFAFFSINLFFSSSHRLSRIFLFGKVVVVYRERSRERELLLNRSVLDVRMLFEHAFQLRLAYASWKAR